VFNGTSNDVPFRARDDVSDTISSPSVDRPSVCMLYVEHELRYVTTGHGDVFNGTSNDVPFCTRDDVSAWLPLRTAHTTVKDKFS